MGFVPLQGTQQSDIPVSITDLYTPESVYLLNEPWPVGRLSPKTIPLQLTYRGPKDPSISPKRVQRAISH